MDGSCPAKINVAAKIKHMCARVSLNANAKAINVRVSAFAHAQLPCPAFSAQINLPSPHRPFPTEDD